MKKVILCIMTLLMGLSLSAQEHLAFEGVPICGDVPACVKALRSKGFKPKVRHEQNLLVGKLYGEPVSLMIAQTAQSETPYLFLVTYPQSSSWDALKSQYEYVKMRLTAFYNTPTNEMESFAYPYTEADGLRAVEYGKCQYVTTWTLPEGEISLSLSQEAQVRIFWIDRAGREQAESEAAGDGSE